VTLPTIICISANPALDRRLRVPSLALGHVTRAQSVQVLPGGKAAHVAMAAGALGASAVWIGFLGGSSGNEVLAGLKQLDVEAAPIRSAASTRANLEIIEDSGRVTEILEPGCVPEQRECREMLRVLDAGLRKRWKGAVVVISGSVPAGTPENLYPSLIVSAQKAGSKVLLDTSGDALYAGLAAKPDLVKPNRTEAETLLKANLRSHDATIDAAHELIRRGARSAAITLGADGLVWMESKKGPVWIARPLRLTGTSSVGCGDAAMAGFAFAFAQKLEPDKVLRLAAACGAANCYAPLPGRISLEEVQFLARQIKIEHR